MVLARWLEQHAPGFANLSNESVAAIHDFSLVWSLFEAKVLNSAANANAILAVANQWANDGKLARDPFATAISYFQARYFNGGQPTHHFAHLNLRPNDHPEIVTRVLRGDAASPQDRAAAALVVSYRYRNNLFHGPKWSYAIQDQQTNFETATELLMTAVDLHAA